MGNGVSRGTTSSSVSATTSGPVQALCRQGAILGGELFLGVQCETERKGSRQKSPHGDSERIAGQSRILLGALVKQ